jgi:GT2 family glycosyltransferase
LEHLLEQPLPHGMKLEVVVCDDGSTDGTGQMLREKFPSVHVTQGNGKLYWGGGMRAAWKKANSIGDFDFYLWLNDDTFLYPNALLRLFQEYETIGKSAILVGACAQPGTTTYAYGGHDEQFMPVPPNGTLQEVTFTNGNLLLIPAAIASKVGSISSAYTHYLGDYDYSFRAIEAGFSCFTSSDYLAECEVSEVEYWDNPKFPLRKRWQLTHSVKGLAVFEYVHFKSYHYGKWIGVKCMVEIYLKLFFPIKYPYYRNLILGRKPLPSPEAEAKAYSESSNFLS